MSMVSPNDLVELHQHVFKPAGDSAPVWLLGKLQKKMSGEENLPS